MSIVRSRSLGFIGIGAMGRPMAENLASKLPPPSIINIYDVSEKAMDELSMRNDGKIVKCSSAKDVAEKSVRIADFHKSLSTFRFSPKGLEAGICTADISNKLIIDCSTIDTATSLSIKENISAKFPSASFYDAPVSGGVIGAKKGTIAFFLGCANDDPNLPQLAELASMIGKQVIPCGGPSLGLAAKLSNNYLSGLIAIACSEAMNMGMRSGLDPRVLANVYAAGTAQNTICDRFNPVPGVYPDSPSSNGYKEGFKVQLMKKDIGLAVEMAQRVGARLALGEAGLKAYADASEDPRCRDLDSRVVYRFLGGIEDWEGREQ
ncbi:NAD binding domain of 6-phosphogluconate dehydrogenase family protein [Coccidioides posadasii C735 delta SOWgp]|uniref:3-hydroxyisobutyrate dehydrogenase n=2 Tax=Coccidioides posadasii TaxID=199306 RepID=A0A0J6F461_COCPO|nr:NAD binding domain of 6-phosphogluconate dehydrogenase family protein [Coccidioides posadasii C735 delta SOWgp]EER28791.1 NAD binding domain of 6-phosphogluconate dehydrogenase family protein [Coccidioides posadasii C735 delta SOWgp]KMM64070.1 3-hydroxyisobutyrate dehydrogenase [Coccidioides posadasii RMSCC 3488]|eukprot:XP_003070936.1 NAD binding domain of 6-phosphogluconate dehydrogenase family protein [Coccidioides posadasii C735 delta SOWgp]